MTSQELRENFLIFFSSQEKSALSQRHIVVPSSSLIPDDPSVLLTTAGMQQFKPYFTGKASAKTDLGSLNAVSIQKCFRTSDIDEVGDERHLTFFEMLGNFSFGGYFKKEAIQYALDFIHSIGLTIEYATIFSGDEKIPKDEESKKIWQEMGIKDIREAGRADNFWGPTGSEGPCGPTTEIYINGTEIWNIVFNEYCHHSDGRLESLKIPGVDTGMGLERLAMISQGKKNIFETDLFTPLIEILPKDLDERIKRIIADHLRGSAFLLSDGVLPSNKEAGYVLRRLMRRVLVYEYLYGVDAIKIKDMVNKVVSMASPRLHEGEADRIFLEFCNEKERFQKSIARGLKELSRFPVINGEFAFRLYESYGLPYEIIKELGAERATELKRADFDDEFKKHQELSRAGQEKKFGGHGLILDTGELKAGTEDEVRIVTRLHTATHLLQAALRKVLGDAVHQDGSDITAERLRFDFVFDRKVTPKELKNIEDLVNSAVSKNLGMDYKEMPYEEAIKTGALYFKKEKYPSKVKVYSAIDPKTGEVFSRELCGGPHVAHTLEVGEFRIVKEESVGAGARRIRAKVFPSL